MAGRRISIAQAAKKLRKSRWTIRRMIERQELRSAARKGKKWWTLDSEEVEAVASEVAKVPRGT